MFQHVLFYVLSNDLVASKKLLITAQNARFQIVFPGDYGATSIGNTNQMPTWYIMLMHILCSYKRGLIYRNIRLSGSDLAMLSLADHSILTYGTFGMWGALLAKGGFVLMPKGYSKHRATHNIELANMTNWIFI